MPMSLTQLGADLLWNPGSVTAEQVPAPTFEAFLAEIYG